MTGWGAEEIEPGAAKTGITSAENMRRLLCSLILALMFSVGVTRTLTLEDLIPGGTNYKAMTPAEISVVWWGDRLVRLESERLSLCTVAAGHVGDSDSWKEFVTLSDIQAIVRAASLPVPTDLKGASFPDPDRPLLRLSTPTHHLTLDIETKSVVGSLRRPGGALCEDLSDGAAPSLAYVKDDNLYVLTSGGVTRQVSFDGSRDIVYGQSVHRDEFGITKGTFWSPSGDLLAFYRMDQSMVPDYPLVDISTPIATLAPTKYPMAGTASHVVTVGIFNPSTDSVVWLRSGDTTDTYLSGITWAPDASRIFLYRLNRDQTHLQLLAFDPLTGEQTAVLYEEHDEKYVHPRHGIRFLPWDSDKFIYHSERSGYNHLYLYSLSRESTLCCLTERLGGVVTELSGLDCDRQALIVTSTHASPLQHNLYGISVASGSPTPLDSGTGVHRALVSASGRYVFDSWSSPDVRRRYDLITTATASAATLFTPADPWEGYDVPTILSGSLKAADDSTDLYYRLILPVGFDSTRLYPAVVYLYGGPGARLVEASFGYNYRGWEIYMAERGYVVFVLDGRGSSERGRAFEDVTFRRLGQVEAADQMRGVDFLRSLPYVDSARLGIHGWSFGGFMTVNMMLSYPGVFRCGVAGGPVIDWRYYEIMYGERYMDTPQANPEGYAAANLRARADSLQGRLLVIFGYNDPVCVPQHSLSFIRACIDAGKQVDMFTYPGAGHNMAGRDRVHLHEKITRYFDDFCRPAASEPSAASAP